jgi:hypothetical protein
MENDSRAWTTRRRDALTSDMAKSPKRHNDNKEDFYQL